MGWTGGRPGPARAVLAVAAVLAASLSSFSGTPGGGAQAAAESASAVPESNDGEGSSQVVVDSAQDELNVRSRPGLNHPVARTVANGSTVDVSCQTKAKGDGNWYRLLDGGYILAAKTKPAEDGADVPPPTCSDAEPRSSTAEDVAAEVSAGATITDRLKARSGPGVDQPAVGTLDKGTAVDIVCRIQGSDVNGSTTWYQLADGTYIAAAFVKASEADAEPCEPGTTGSAGNEVAALAADEQRTLDAASDDPSVLANATSKANEESVLFVVDTSGSMFGTRLEQAKAALRQGIASLADRQAAGLRHYPSNYCDGGRLLVPIAPDNRVAMQTAVEGLVADGQTPTGPALQAAVADLPPSGSRTIVLISDGEANCGGDPCQAARDLVATTGIKFTVQAVGFNVTGAAPAQLQCIADATGGRYFEATDSAGLAEAIKGAIPGGTSRYVALGDSYSSGEGNPPFLTGTDVRTRDRATTNVCHQSVNAYGPQLADRLNFSGTNFTFGACSGAILAHLSEAVGGVGQWNGRPQLDAIAPFDTPSSTTSLVTLTIGGNDIGFASGLNSCVRGTGKNELFHGDCRKTLNRLAEQGLKLLRSGGTIEINKKDGHWKFCNPSKERCRNDRSFVTSTVSDLAGMIGKIRDRAPNARILVPLYPHLFPENPPNRCIVGQAENRAGKVFSYVIDKDAADRLNQIADDLDSVLMQEVQQARRRGLNVDYVETRDAFYGHSIQCINDAKATPQPWINGLLFDNATALTVSPSPFSFHPNSRGHRKLTRLVQDRI